MDPHMHARRVQWRKRGTFLCRTQGSDWLRPTSPGLCFCTAKAKHAAKHTASSDPSQEAAICKWESLDVVTNQSSRWAPVGVWVNHVHVTKTVIILVKITGGSVNIIDSLTRAIVTTLSRLRPLTRIFREHWYESHSARGATAEHLRFFRVCRRFQVKMRPNRVDSQRSTTPQTNQRPTGTPHHHSYY